MLCTGVVGITLSLVCAFVTTMLHESMNSADLVFSPEDRVELQQDVVAAEVLAVVAAVLCMSYLWRTLFKKPAPAPEPQPLLETSGGVHVRCLEGFDGGQPQTFVLEVLDAAGGQQLANLSSRAPHFTVEGLAPGQALRLSVYAANSKGRSDAVHFEGATLKAAEKQTDPK